MIVNKRVYHAGNFKNKSENLSVGLHGTSFCSGYFFTTTKEACENQGAGFNKDHPRPVYSFDISNLDLFPTTWQDCKTLNLFNKSLYYWPVYQTYFDSESLPVYKKIYKSLLACFEGYYADNVAEEKRVSKFLRELKDSYIIEAEDVAEIDGQLYSFQDYVDDTRSLKNLKNSLSEIKSTFHNTLPLLSDFLMNADNVDILKNKSLLEREIEYTLDNLKNELENFIDNFELASSIDNMLQKVADLVDIDKEGLIDIANIISNRYVNFYDKTTGRFDNWSINKNEDLFATQLLLRLGYQGTYPVDDMCDSTEWGGVIFHLEAVENAELV